jgi:hypothetical protein
MGSPEQDAYLQPDEALLAQAAELREHLMFPLSAERRAQIVQKMGHIGEVLYSRLDVEVEVPDTVEALHSA